jgi:hypothetical protein
MNAAVGFSFEGAVEMSDVQAWIVIALLVIIIFWQWLTRRV